MYMNMVAILTDLGGGFGREGAGVTAGWDFKSSFNAELSNVREGAARDFKSSLKTELSNVRDLGLRTLVVAMTQDPD